MAAAAAVAGNSTTREERIPPNRVSTLDEAAAKIAQLEARIHQFEASAAACGHHAAPAAVASHALATFDDPAKIAELYNRLVPLESGENPARAEEGRQALLERVRVEARKSGLNQSYPFAQHVHEFEKAGLFQCVAMIYMSPFFHTKMYYSLAEFELAYLAAVETDNDALFEFMKRSDPNYSIYKASVLLFEAVKRDKLAMVRALGAEPWAEKSINDIALNALFEKRNVQLMRVFLSLKAFTLTMEQLTQAARKEGWISFAEDMAKTPTIDDKKGA